MAGEVEEFATRNLRSPVRVEVQRSGATAERAQQCVYEVEQPEKNALLLALLAEDDASTLVFTRTRRRADKLAKLLLRSGVRVVQLHADRSQAQRKFALDGFKSKRYRVLVATDVASRGIDVAEIGHVVNYDLPHSPEDYVHRIGRTARAAASGRASSFSTSEDAPMLAGIERFIAATIPRAEVPRYAPAFVEQLADEKARQADPGPKQAAPAPKPPGAPMGRHARTHPKKPKPG
jgi:ATP-dependent RNA helicase RhlE